MYNARRKLDIYYYFVELFRLNRCGNVVSTIFVFLTLEIFAGNHIKGGYIISIDTYIIGRYIFFILFYLFIHFFFYIHSWVVINPTREKKEEEEDEGIIRESINRRRGGRLYSEADDPRFVRFGRVTTLPYKWEKSDIHYKERESRREGLPCAIYPLDRSLPTPKAHSHPISIIERYNK